MQVTSSRLLSRPPIMPLRLLLATLSVALVATGCVHDNGPADRADGGGDGAAVDGAVADGAVVDSAGPDAARLDSGAVDVAAGDGLDGDGLGADGSSPDIPPGGDAADGNSNVAPDTPPTVQWLQPAADTVALLGTSVAFVAQVGDDTTKPADLGFSLTLTNAAAPKGMFLDADALGKISFTLSDLPAGKNTLVLTVYDAAGQTTSAKLNVLINTAPGAPVVAIEPAMAKTGDTLVAVLVQPAVDAEDGPLPAAKHSFQWSLGAKIITDLTGAKVPAARTAAGQTWRVVVRASDGSAAGLQATAVMTIGNTAPSGVALKLTSSLPGEMTPTVASQVKCVFTKAAVDPDGDKVSYLIR